MKHPSSEGLVAFSSREALAWSLAAYYAACRYPGNFLDVYIERFASHFAAAQRDELPLCNDENATLTAEGSSSCA